MSGKQTSRSNLWGVLAGGAVGFAVGVLFAPTKGRRLRRRLAYQMERTAVRAGNYFRHLASADLAPDAPERRGALTDEMRAEADHIRDDIDALLEELRERAGTQSSSASE